MKLPLIKHCYCKVKISFRLRVTSNSVSSIKVSNYILPFFFLFLINSIQAQIEGHWAGEITQDEGGYRSSYRLIMHLEVEGDQIKGLSIVSVDSIFAELTIAGTVSGGMLLTLKDVELLNHRIIPGIEWCFKSYQLIFKKEGEEEHLEGFWQGNTSFSTCIPGKVILRRIVVRA